MMNMTNKQLITLLLMTATLVMILAMLPEQPSGTAQKQASTQLVSQASK